MEINNDIVSPKSDPQNLKFDVLKRRSSEKNIQQKNLEPRKSNSDDRRMSEQGVKKSVNLNLLSKRDKPEA